ncbi:uncharacterized protein YbjT (DUF2867 family) [Pseudomonas sp. TE3786]
MKNLETPAVKLAVYGAQSSVGNALMVEALARQFETTLVLDDLNAVAARPGLSTVQGDLFDPISVSQSIAGKDAVVCVLPTGNADTRFHQTFKAVAALLDGLPVAGVKRLLLVGDFSWLDDSTASLSEPLQQLQDRLTGSPVVWTLFDAPSADDDVQQLGSFAGQVVDEVCHADNMHQRIRIHSQASQTVQTDIDVMPQP